MEIDVWSDIACPWCALGRDHLREALEQVGGEEVSVRWRAFQLDPNAPPRVEGDHAEHLARKYGMSVDRARQMTAAMVERGSARGVTFDFDRMQSGNMFDAHRVLALAWERGVQDAVHGRFMRAYFAEGALMSDPDTLVRLAAEAGLDEVEVRAVLSSDAHGDAVRQDQAIARQLGVSGVPFYVFGRKVGVSGAQPAEVLVQALRQAQGA